MLPSQFNEQQTKLEEHSRGKTGSLLQLLLTHVVTRAPIDACDQMKPQDSDDQIPSLKM